MINAKKEFIEYTKGLKIICARLRFDCEEAIILKVGYTKKDYDNFLNKIDKNYDDGYGAQELYGTIWCKNGIWLERAEYDGSEWWVEHQYPEIDDTLKQIEDLEWVLKDN